MFETNVIASAVVTALLTTLSVEYLAKPWLEVRKERILDEHRRRRAMQTALISLAVHVGKTSGLPEFWDAAPELALTMVDDFMATADEVAELLPVASNWRLPDAVVRRMTHGIGRLQGSLHSLRAALVSDSDRRHEAVSAVTEAYERLVPAADYMILKGRTHRQPIINRIRTRRAALRAVRSDSSES